MKTYGKLYREAMEGKEGFLSSTQMKAMDSFFQGKYAWILDMPYDMVSKEIFDFCVTERIRGNELAISKAAFIEREVESQVRAQYGDKRVGHNALTHEMAVCFAYHSKRAFDLPCVHAELLKLQEKEKMNFGEMLLLTLTKEHERTAAPSFDNKYRAAKLLFPFHKADPRTLKCETVQATFEDQADYQVILAVRMLRRILAAAKNGLDQHSIISGLLAQKPSEPEAGETLQEMLDSLQGSGEFTLSANDTLRTVYKRWLFLNKNRYSEKTLQNLFYAYRKLHQLQDIPYRQIRCVDIMDYKGKVEHWVWRLIKNLYAKLDLVAYAESVISIMYSNALQDPNLPSTKSEEVPEREIKRLRAHRDRFSAEFVLTWMDTGVSLRELICLKHGDLDVEKMALHVTGAMRKYEERTIPCTREMMKSLQRVFAYLNAIGFFEKSDSAKIRIISKLRLDAVSRYCSKNYGGRNFRETFAGRLVRAGVPLSAVENLKGSFGDLVKATDTVYVHHTLDFLRKQVERVVAA